MARAGDRAHSEDGEDKGCVEKTHLDTCKNACTGDAWWLYNIFCCPFVLVWNALWIYLLACIGVWLQRAVYYLLCCCFCESWFYFRDKKFPARASSIIDPSEPPFEDNEFYGSGLDAVGMKIDWVRADDILREKQKVQIMQNTHLSESEKKKKLAKHMHLFADGISPEDIVQGKIGDCWLLAALASMAEHPDAIRRCFQETHATVRGKYHVRIYDIAKKRWSRVSVDEYIPVKAGTKEPYFSNPQGLELWAVLIEKAVAKHIGGYAYLDGGRTVFLWHLLTSDTCYSFKRPAHEDVWQRFIYEFRGSTSKKDQKHKMLMTDTHERCDTARLFEVLKRFTRNRAVLGAAIHDKAKATQGLQVSHAYSVLNVIRAHGFSLIKLRNPWGRGEWEGDWSDRSPLWSKYPDVRKRCQLEEDPFDAAFWMPFDEFAQRFDRVDVCDRTTSRDLRLDVREDEGALGVCKGCALGCVSFWCLCRGLRTIYCGHRTSEEVNYKKSCCRPSQGRAWVDPGHSIV